MPMTQLRTAMAVVLLATLGGGIERDVAAQGPSTSMPVFEVDASWPKLPNNWVLGGVPAVATDRRDHVWILHRPRLVVKGQEANAAPPVLEFDAAGKFIRGWGGPADGYEWPTGEHGITVDYKGNIWITGYQVTDDMLLKFTNEGKFLMQIGKRGQSTGNADQRNVNRPADIFVLAKTNEVFVADGYGNRRVIVFDADTGAFKRMWGAFGNPPDSNPAAGSPAAVAAATAAREGRAGGAAGATAVGRGRGPAPVLETEGPGSPTFANPVHAVKISNDGLVYIGDRSNRRIQVFTIDGKFVTQAWVNRGGPTSSSTCGLAFSPDPEQRFLYNADFGNARMVVLDRKTLQPLYQFGLRGTKPGEFTFPHHLATDTKGNLYVAEVQEGRRAQRFVYKGLSTTLPPNALTPAQLAVPAQ